MEVFHSRDLTSFSYKVLFSCLMYVATLTSDPHVLRIIVPLAVMTLVLAINFTKSESKTLTVLPLLLQPFVHLSDLYWGCALVFLLGLFGRKATAAQHWLQYLAISTTLAPKIIWVLFFIAQSMRRTRLAYLYFLYGLTQQPLTQFTKFNLLSFATPHLCKKWSFKVRWPVLPNVPRYNVPQINLVNGAILLVVIVSLLCFHA